MHLGWGCNISGIYTLIPKVGLYQNRGHDFLDVAHAYAISPIFCIIQREYMYNILYNTLFCRSFTNESFTTDLLLKMVFPR